MLEHLEGRYLLAGVPEVLFGSDGGPSSVTQIAVLGEQLIYSGSFSGKGTELGISDGTSEGTRLIKDIRPGSIGSSPSGFVEFNDELYFTANDGVTGTELWKTDGTADGTVMVADINPTGNSGPGNFTVLNDAIIFTANDGATGIELWRTDGTAEGTVQIADIRPGSNSSTPTALATFNDKVYFSANDGVRGFELWSSTGEVGNANLVADLNPGSTSTSISFAKLVGDAGLFFGAKGPSAFLGTDLYLIDHSDNLIQVTDINTGFDGVRNRGPHNVTPMGILNGDLVFQAETRVVDPSSPDSNLDLGNELWISDGTRGGTRLVKDIFVGSGDSLPVFLGIVNGNILFRARDNDHGFELWQTDGTEAGTTLLMDHNPGPQNGNPNPGGTLVGDTFYFNAFDPVHGQELWETNGTTDGTVLVADVFPGTFVAGGSTFPNSSSPSSLTEFQGTLAFAATVANSTTRLLILRPPVDLLVASNSANDPFAGDGIIETQPSEAQTQMLIAPQGVATRYRVRVENEGNEEKAFLLKVATSSVPAGFSVRYYDGVGNLTDTLPDITAQVAGEGFLTALIPGNGGFKDITVEIVPSSAVANNTEVSVVVQVFDPDKASAPIDAVKVVARAGLFVTTTADGEDTSDDGVVDIDPNTPGQQISLREAIKLANAGAPGATINFEMTDGSTILVGSAGLGALPAITQSVTINAVQPNGNVVLDGGTSVSTGLRFDSILGHLSINDLEVRNFVGDGIAVSSPVATLFLEEIIVQGNGGTGIRSVGSITFDGQENHILGNGGDGVKAGRGITLTGVLTDISNNTGRGIVSSGLGDIGAVTATGLLIVSHNGGDGILVETDPVGMDLAKVLLIGNTGHGINSPGSLTVNDLRAESNGGDGVRVLQLKGEVDQEGEPVSIRIEGNEGTGLHLLGDGLQLPQPGASETVRSTIITGNHGFGIFQDGVGTINIGGDTEINTNRLGGISTSGHVNFTGLTLVTDNRNDGVKAGRGITFTGAQTEISHNEGHGIVASGFGDKGAVTATGELIVLFNEGDGILVETDPVGMSLANVFLIDNLGHGINSSASLTVNNLRAESNRGFGIFQDGVGNIDIGGIADITQNRLGGISTSGHVNFADLVLVADNRGDGVKAGRGITFTGDQAEISHNTGRGIVASGFGDNGAVTATGELFVSFNGGDGIHVETDPVGMNLAKIILIGNSGHGINSPGNLTFNELLAESNGGDGVRVLQLKGEVGQDDAPVSIKIERNFGSGLHLLGGGLDLPEFGNSENFGGSVEFFGITHNGGFGIFQDGGNGLIDIFSFPAEVSFNGLGGVRTPGSATMTNVHILRNGGGGANIGGDLTVIGGVICGNTGGDVFVLGTADLTNVIACADFDTDEDGIVSGIEDAGPNNGDGNFDGIPDSLQSTVVSLPNARNGRYVTLVTSTPIVGTRASTLPEDVTPPTGVFFPLEFFNFSVTELTPGGTTSVVYFLPPGVVLDGCMIFGPTLDDTTPHFYDFTYDGVTGAEIFDDRVVFHFVDGLRGDSDLAVNGVVTVELSGLFGPRPPELDLGGDASVAEGADFIHTGSIVAPDSTSFIVIVNYGDGSAGQSVPVFPDNTFFLNHVYADNGAFEVTVAVTDDLGSTSTATMLVSVTNVAPTVDAGADQSIHLGEEVNLVGLFTDPGTGDTHLIAWTVTDENDQVVATGNSLSLAFTPGVSGTFIAQLTVTDDDGASGSDSVAILVQDTDGIDNAIEDAGPNNGDGNGDGILDSLQNNVASFLDVVTGSYLTLVAPEGTNLVNVQALEVPSSPLPSDLLFPVGFAGFQLTGLTPGAAVTVDLLISGGVVGDRYIKFGATPDNAIPSFYEWTFNGSTGAEFLSDRIRLHFVDGGLGDSDLTADGVIEDPGAPALSRIPVVTTEIPTDVFEGGLVTVNGFVTDVDSTQLTGVVDFGDGSPIAQLTVQADGSFIADHVFADNGTFDVTVTITDESGFIGVSTVTLVVLNAAPTVTITGPDSVIVGEAATFMLTATDVSAVDQAANFTFEIDWDGDGTIDETVVVPSGLTVSRVFPEEGDNDIVVTATDKDGATSEAAVLSIDVVRGGGGGLPGTAEIIDGDLVVIGTDGNDHITIRPDRKSPGQVKVRINRVQIGSFAPTGIIRVAAGLGNDEVHISKQVLIDSIVDGGPGNDVLRGGGGNDLLRGGDGDDELRATLGNDILMGGAGNDLLFAGEGDDQLFGGDGDDELRGHRGNDLLDGGAGNDLIRGGQGDDVIDGGAGDDTIFGGAGNDVMRGGDGDDVIEGGAGDDTIFGGAGNDVIRGGQGDDVIDGGAGNDTIFGGAGNDLIRGGEGDDEIDGGSGDDILLGGEGNDRVDGGGGRDLLIGGWGQDLLRGQGDEDILIGGRTDFDANDEALTLLLAEWSRSTNYDDRVWNVTTGSGSLAGRGVRLDSSTVHDDNAYDVLEGNGDRDLFFYNFQGAGTKDRIKDFKQSGKKAETRVDID